MDALWAVGFDELFGDFLGSVWGAVVDDYDFPVDFAREKRRWCVSFGWLFVKLVLVVPTYFSSKVFASSHVMIGRLRRSWYVGNNTEYLFLTGAIFVDMILLCW